MMKELDGAKNGRKFRQTRFKKRAEKKYKGKGLRPSDVMMMTVS